LAQYKTVLARPNVYDSHDLAEKGLHQPYTMPSVVAASGDEGQ
jgi:hypothetical protein